MHPSAGVRDDPESSCEEVARLRLHLSEHSLSELVEKEVLEQDEGENSVRKGGLFSEVWNEIM
jgi:hypothetical protein